VLSLLPQTKYFLRRKIAGRITLHTGAEKNFVIIRLPFGAMQCQHAARRDFHNVALPSFIETEV
jgi:hypothetical protein